MTEPIAEPAESDSGRHQRLAWDTTFARRDGEGWTVDKDTPRDELTETLTAAYHLHSRNHMVVRAAIVAAAERFGDSWTAQDFTGVSESFAECFEGGWAGLATEHVDQTYPGLPTSWLRDLGEIGRELRTKTEQYVELEGQLFIFDRNVFPSDRR